MKGQQRIISEIMVFGMGIVMVILVLSGFEMLRGSMEKVSVRDGLEETSEIILYGILKTVYAGDNASIIVKIPSKIWTSFGPVSGETSILMGVEYEIKIVNNQLVLAALSGASSGSEGVVRKNIFKLENEYNVQGDVISNPGYVTIKKTGDDINIMGSRR
jgi:hypothetical protein